MILAGIPISENQCIGDSLQYINSAFQTLSGSVLSEDFIVACSNETTSLTPTISVVTFRMPFAMKLNTLRASLNIAAVGQPLIVDVNQNGSSVLSKRLSIDAGETTSVTAVTAVDLSNSTLTDNSVITIDIDQVGSTTPGAGLKVTFKGQRI